MDLCRFAGYAGDYFQLQGPDAFIHGYNTLSPEQWSE